MVDPPIAFCLNFFTASKRGWGIYLKFGWGMRVLLHALSEFTNAEFSMVTLEKFLNHVAGGIILTAMMVLVAGDVLGRYLFNQPIHGTTEITEFMMVGLLYFTLSHAQALKAHIKVDFLLSLISSRARLICEEITYALGFLLFVLITWQTAAAALKAWTLGETTFGLILFPLFPAKVLIPIGCSIVCLRFLLDFFQGLRDLKKTEPP